MKASEPMGSAGQAMTSTERFSAVMNFEPFDRLPVIEWASWWNKTIDAWHGQGLDEGLTDRYEICRHFGLEIYYQDWISPRGRGCPKPVAHGAGLIARPDEYDGIREHLFPREIDRDLWARWAGHQRREDAVLWFSMDGFFWFARTLLGIEQHLYAFYDAPDLISRINDELADWMLWIVEQLCEICRPDFMTFAEDMCYNHGPMLSKKMFDEFLMPYYHRVVPFLKQKGIVTFIDCDGDVASAAPWFDEAGMDGILPLERQSGVDVLKIRGSLPEMRFIGCFDKMTMTRGESAMRGEFERLMPAATKGGLIIGCDHQTPPGVSYDQYVLYVRLLKEYAERAGQEQPR